MDFRRSAARRRRVMREDLLDSGSSRSAAPCKAGQFQIYQSAEVLRNQPLLLDWFPQSLWTNVLSIVLLAAVGSGLLAGHYHQILQPWFGNTASVGHAHWESLFSLSQASSLSQLFWTATGLASLYMCYQLFLLRRHREDDYQGTYRVWLWSLPVAALMAGVGVPSLRIPFQLLLEAGLPAARVPLVWGGLVAAMALAVGLIGLRLLWEIAESKLALISMIAAVAVAEVAMGLVVAVAWNLPIGPLGSLPADLPYALGFVATTSWTVSLTAYLGYVCRDIAGWISHSQPEADSIRSKSPSAASKKVTNEDSLPSPAESAAESLDAPDDVGPIQRRKRRRVA